MDTPLNLVPVGNINKLYKRTKDGGLIEYVAADNRPFAMGALIANGASQSAAAVLDGLTPVLLMIPANFQGGALEFHVSADGVTFLPLHASSGSRMRIPVAAGTAVRLLASDWLGIKALKITSVTTAGAAVNQTAAVSLTIVTVP